MIHAGVMSKISEKGAINKGYTKQMRKDLTLLI
jgi:hypothetical protein